MQPFWDVFWSDVRALVVFALPMLVVSLPVSFLAALLGGVNFGVGSWSRVARSAMRGFLLGSLTAIVVSMSIELLLTAEGFPESRRAIRAAANWQLFLAGPLLVFLCSFMAARRYAPANGQPQRRYSLRQLFVYQLIAGSLLGWWTFTRRGEIVQRRHVLQWQLRDHEARTVFEPLGWTVQTWPDSDEIMLMANGTSLLGDQSLAPLVTNQSVVYVHIHSDAITDVGLKYLRGANRLRRLKVASKQITDAGVAELSDLPRLRYVEVYSPQLTDDSLASLAKLRVLRRLVISRARLSDERVNEFLQAKPGVDFQVSPY
jgi:hypothetical protein